MIRNREYRFVLVFGLLAVAITSVPYLIGTAMATDQRAFGGFVYTVEDCYSYLAKMRQGAEGAWLFHLPYTPDPHPPAFFYLFHLMLGKIAAALPLGDLAARMVWTYHLARCLFGLALLFTLYRFLAALSDRLLVRRLAWLLVTFGGGLGWVLVAVGRPEWLGSLPLDFILPEGFTFLVLYALPHLALARSLLLWGLLALLRAWEIQWTDDVVRTRGRPGPSALPPLGWALVAGLLWLAMGVIVPFYAAVAWAVAGTALVLVAVRERRLPRFEAGLAGAAVLASCPIVLYSAWRVTSHPVYQSWAAQIRSLSPHPLHYLVAYGLPLSLAVAGVRDAWRSDKPAWLALAWVGVVPLLVYLPFTAQRRLAEAMQAPLSLLAAMGLTSIVHRRPGGSGLRSTLAMAAVLLALMPTNVMLVAESTLALQGRPAPIYRERAELAALDWLGQQVDPSDVVLSSYDTGNYLPARVRARALVGHGPESVNADQKKLQVERFFASTTDDAWRRGLLRTYGVDYVFWGPLERELGGFDPRAAAYLHATYEHAGYTILEVAE